MILTENKAGFEPMIQSGKTAQGGLVTFVDAKTKNITFQLPFVTSPQITLTLDSDSNTIPYALNINLTGFQIKFKTNYTGAVIWTAIRI